jgi:hypothetical protein
VRTIIVAAALLVVGCGGSEATQAPEPTPTPTTVTPTPTTVTPTLTTATSAVTTQPIERNRDIDDWCGDWYRIEVAVPTSAAETNALIGETLRLAAEGIRFDEEIISSRSQVLLEAGPGEEYAKAREQITLVCVIHLATVRPTP